ncbi:MAG: zinc-ribbon domain-containing protein [Planctomycetaceae bacterium]|jgi:hypothetical protein|nr:zinc-ribbon domain-containing protein [Planctomycetaceae bacterium]MCE2812325.1 zinc-ribbon domain-containing protein [Planctomycetaceae bacterium]
MKIQVHCPQCHREYNVKKTLLTRKLKCKCGKVFQVQSPSDGDTIESSQVAPPSGFWDERFEEIADDIPKEQPSVVHAAKATKQGCNFEVILPMDPFTGGILYSLVCSLVGLVLLALMVPFRSFLSPLLGLGLFGAFPIFGLATLIYRYRAHYVNHVTLAIRDEGISILYHKALPWPCRNRIIPVESIEEIRMETNTVQASWLLPRAEYSHTTYGSKSSYNYVFVYDLKCKLKNKHFETRLLTVESRDLANSIRLQLKRLKLDRTDES